MDINYFIQNFADQFDDTPINEFTPEASFRDLDEWSSLTALAVLNMIEKKCNAKLTLEEFREVKTIQELYDLVKSKI